MRGTAIHTQLSNIMRSERAPDGAALLLQIVLIIGIAMCVFGVLMLAVALLLARRLRQQGRRGWRKPRQAKRCLANFASCSPPSSSPLRFRPAAQPLIVHAVFLHHHASCRHLT